MQLFYDCLPYLKKTLKAIRHLYRQLSGVRGWLWFLIIIFGLVTITVPFAIAAQPGTYATISQKVGGTIGLIIAYAIITGIFIIPLVGLLKRKPFSVPYSRVILVISMFWIPIGTIIGAILWKRINHPLAKKYLNYGV